MLNVNISERVRASVKMRRTSFIDLDICQRIIQFLKLHIITLTYFFKVKNLKF